MVDVDGKIPNTTVSVESAASLMLEHIQLYLEDGARAHIWDSAPVGGPGSVPTLLLTTTGAKSGDQRHAPLVYGAVDGAYVVVASGGNERHPSWYYNLVAQPLVRIKVASDEKRVRARTAEGDERRRLWDHMTIIYPPYMDYQEHTRRTIPVVLLEEC